VLSLGKAPEELDSKEREQTRYQKDEGCWLRYSRRRSHSQIIEPEATSRDPSQLEIPDRHGR